MVDKHMTEDELREYAAELESEVKTLRRRLSVAGNFCQIHACRHCDEPVARVSMRMVRERRTVIMSTGTVLAYPPISTSKDRANFIFGVMSNRPHMLLGLCYAGFVLGGSTYLSEGNTMTELTRLPYDAAKIKVPTHGEDLGAVYRFRANHRAQEGHLYGAAHDFRWAELYYRIAAARSIGHNRTARYQQAADECWRLAEKYHAQYNDDIAGPGNGN